MELDSQQSIISVSVSGMQQGDRKVHVALIS